jgi:receptor protein-tyrosine kinase
VFDATIRTAIDLAIASGLPVVGSLPEIKGREVKGRTGVKAIAHVPAVSETLRGLCVTLRSETQEKGEAILITSCDGGEGKTTLAAALAETYADDGFRVLLVEGDLRRPRLSSVLGVSPTQTLESVLAGAVPWNEAVVGCSDSRLDCLLAGGKSRSPVSAMNSQHLARLIEESRVLYDFVILDSPPVLRVADPLLLAQYCQHVLFIVRAGFMSPDLVSQATQRFPDADRKKVRTMLVRVSPSEIDRGDYYGGYGLTELEAA